MNNEKTQFPILKWAQIKDRLFIKINVVHSAKPTVDVVDGKKLSYKGTDGKTQYAFEIELYDEVIKEESKYNLDARTIFLNLKKKTEGPYWPRLVKENLKYQWIQVDWANYVDEEEAKQPGFDGQDFGNLNDELDEDDEVSEGERTADLSDLEE